MRPNNGTRYNPIPKETISNTHNTHTITHTHIHTYILHTTTTLSPSSFLDAYGPLTNFALALSTIPRCRCRLSYTSRSRRISSRYSTIVPSILPHLISSHPIHPSLVPHVSPDLLCRCGWSERLLLSHSHNWPHLFSPEATKLYTSDTIAALIVNHFDRNTCTYISMVGE